VVHDPDVSACVVDRARAFGAGRQRVDETVVGRFDDGHGVRDHLHCCRPASRQQGQCGEDSGDESEEARGREDHSSSRPEPLRANRRGGSRRELSLAPRERRRLRRLGRNRLERRERIPVIVLAKLEDPLRPVEVLQMVLSEVEQLNPRRKLFLDEFTCRAREEDLTAVAGRADTGRPMDAETDVALPADGRLGSVDADADPYLLSVGPGVARERALRGESSGDRVLRAGEGDEERVTLRVDLVAACFLEGGAEQALMLGQDVSVLVAKRFQQARRAFDVAEEEGDRPGWKLRHLHDLRTGAWSPKLLRARRGE
jgi:hypothetical protein